MRDGWAVVRLSEIANRKTLKNLAKIDLVFTVSAQRGLITQEEYFTKRVASSNLTNYYVVQPGDYVFNKSYSVDAPFGVIAKNTSTNPGLVSPLYIVFGAKREIIEQDFLGLALTSVIFWKSLEGSLKEGGRGHGALNLKVGDFFEALLPLPPIPEQKRIVDLISSVDSYIEALQQQLVSAKKSRNAVLHELMTARGNDWVVRKLPEVVEVLDRMRKPINSTEREDRKGNIPYYGANGQTGWIDEFIFNEELVLLGEDAIDFADPSARKAYLIQGPSWVNNHAHVLRADKTIVNSYFLMESLNKVDYSQYVSFGTRSKLTQASMNGIKLLIPPMNIQKKFVDLLENFDKVIEATQRSIEDSKELRTGILSNLLSGEHEIPTSYDKFIGAA